MIFNIYNINNAKFLYSQVKVDEIKGGSNLSPLLRYACPRIHDHADLPGPPIPDWACFSLHHAKVIALFSTSKSMDNNYQK